MPSEREKAEDAMRRAKMNAGRATDYGVAGVVFALEGVMHALLDLGAIVEAAANDMQRPRL